MLGPMKAELGRNGVSNDDERNWINMTTIGDTIERQLNIKTDRWRHRPLSVDSMSKLDRLTSPCTSREVRVTEWKPGKG